jgi:basic membrane protein A
VAADGSGQVRVGLVLEQPVVGRASDPFQVGAFHGLVRAARDLHVKAKAVAPSPTRANQYADLFRDLGRQHYDLVIGVGFLELQAISQATREFPNEKFGLLDASRQEVQPPPRNLEGTVFHTEQAAYLAGFLAARIADRGPPPHVVSSVGGVELPPVQAYIAGFQAGAEHADPRIKLLNAYSDDFLNESKCRHIALAQIARGSRVVFDVAGACGIGALEAAKQKHRYGIGVDIDQSYLGKFILTSVVKNLNLAVYEFVRRFVAGRLKMGGNLSFDLRNHGVYLGKFGPVVRPALRRELIPLAAQIEQGKIVVPTTLSPSH